MDKFLNRVKIKNFKSIKDISLDLSRINIFIGRTNTGKTNILEAISLLGKSYGSEFFSDIINYESIENLFYFNNIEEIIEIVSDDKCISLSSIPDKNSYLFFRNFDCNEYKGLNFTDFKNKTEFLQKAGQKGIDKLIDIHKLYWSEIDSNFILTGDLLKESNIKTYKFKRTDFKDKKNQSLNPPFGSNLFRIVSSYKSVRDDLVKYLDDYNLEVVFNPKDNDFQIQKKESGFVYQLPLSVLADTLQRAIFYYAAIKSNTDSVILLEEPEVHSYPPYIKDMAQNIIDSKQNQFLISTHSPYLFDSLIENADSDISVFLIDYSNHETKAKKLSDDNINEILSFGYDIFLNLENFYERF